MPLKCEVLQARKQRLINGLVSDRDQQMPCGHIAQESATGGLDISQQPATGGIDNTVSVEKEYTISEVVAARAEIYRRADHTDRMVSNWGLLVFAKIHDMVAKVSEDDDEDGIWVGYTYRGGPETYTTYDGFCIVNQYILPQAAQPQACLEKLLALPQRPCHRSRNSQAAC